MPALDNADALVVGIADCCHAGGIGEPRDLAPSAQVAIGSSDGCLNELKTGTGRAIISATRGTWYCFFLCRARRTTEERDFTADTRLVNGLLPSYPYVRFLDSLP